MASPRLRRMSSQRLTEYTSSMAKIEKEMEEDETLITTVLDRSPDGQYNFSSALGSNNSEKAESSPDLVSSPSSTSAIAVEQAEAALRKYAENNYPHDNIMKWAIQQVCYFKGLVDKGAGISKAQIERCRRILGLIERRIVWAQLIEGNARGIERNRHTTITSENTNPTVEQMERPSDEIQIQSRASTECTKNASSMDTDTTDDVCEASHHDLIVDAKDIMTDTCNLDAAFETGPSERWPSVESVTKDGNKSDDNYSEDGNSDEFERVSDDCEIGSFEEMDYRPCFGGEGAQRDSSLETVLEDSDEE